MGIWQFASHRVQEFGAERLVGKKRPTGAWKARNKEGQEEAFGRAEQRTEVSRPQGAGGSESGRYQACPSVLEAPLKRVTCVRPLAAFFSC